MNTAAFTEESYSDALGSDWSLLIGNNFWINWRLGIAILGNASGCYCEVRLACVSYIGSVCVCRVLYSAGAPILILFHA